MADPAGDLARKIRNIMPFLNAELDDFADRAEQHAKAHTVWQDDTGSAKAGITAFRLDANNPAKHEAEVNWANARAVGSAKYGTPPINFEPQHEDVDLGDDPGVVLTMYAKYTVTVGGHVTIEDAQNAMSTDFERTVGRALEQALQS